MSPMNPYEAGMQANKNRLSMDVIDLRRRRPPYTCRLGLYCIASAMCAVWICSLPAKSAIVRASLSTRW